LFSKLEAEFDVEKSVFNPWFDGSGLE